MCSLSHARAASLALLVCLSVACGPSYLTTKTIGLEEEKDFVIDDEAKILDNDDTRKVTRIVAEYRSALVRKNFGTIRELIAEDYYDNAGTTSTTLDDYGHKELTGTVFEMVASHAENIQYRVTIKDVRVREDRASVDYEFRYAYQYRVGEEMTWDAGIDVNRIEMRKRNGDWKIISGL
jgi:hypothetical protein